MMFFCIYNMHCKISGDVSIQIYILLRFLYLILTGINVICVMYIHIGIRCTDRDTE